MWHTKGGWRSQFHRSQYLRNPLSLVLQKDHVIHYCSCKIKSIRQQDFMWLSNTIRLLGFITSSFNAKQNLYLWNFISYLLNFFDWNFSQRDSALIYDGICKQLNSFGKIYTQMFTFQHFDNSLCKNSSVKHLSGVLKWSQYPNLFLWSCEKCLILYTLFWFRIEYITPTHQYQFSLDAKIFKHSNENCNFLNSDGHGFSKAEWLLYDKILLKLSKSIGTGFNR